MKTARIGLILAALLGLSDIAILGGDVVPMPAAIAGAVLGLVTVVAAILAWRRRRAALVTVVVTRILSAVSALPAFFVADAPGAARVAAVAVVAVTAVAVALLAPTLRGAAPVH